MNEREVAYTSPQNVSSQKLMIYLCVTFPAILFLGVLAFVGCAIPDHQLIVAVSARSFS